MADPIRILFLADSHLGFDLPAQPRVERRRRGHDFQANYEAALASARAGRVDLVVHGGDVFHRPRVPAGLAYRAYEPLLRVAEAGVPVVVVPGNHERGRLPHVRLAQHPRVHVFDVPRTYVVEVRGVRLALSGFPYEPRGVRARFPELLERTGWRSAAADVRLLCVHHCVEGATVGPAEYTFTSAPDVIRGRDLPAGFAAVLSGHIHRHQVLTRHLSGRPLAAPVLYPGSVERTATAEIGESKGYLLLEVSGDGRVPLRWAFRELPARPMLVRTLAAGGSDGSAFDASLRALIASLPPDAVVSVRVEGEVGEAHRRIAGAARLRQLVPPTMNLEVAIGRGFARRPSRGRPGRTRPQGVGNLELGL